MKCCRSNGCGIHSNSKSRLIHHLEHVFEALVGFTYEVSFTGRLSSHHQVYNGSTLVSHLVVDALGEHIIWGSIQSNFWNHK